VRVAEDDDIGIIPRCQFRGGWASDFVAVADVHPDAVDCNDDFFAQPRLTGRVGIAEHSLDRRDQSELVQNAGAADISGMKNELDSRQRLTDAGPKKPMRIGDESYYVRFGG